MVRQTCAEIILHRCGGSSFCYVWRVRSDVMFFFFFLHIVIMSCFTCASMAGRYMGGSCGWTDLIFISRRSDFRDLQQTRPKCIFEHDKRHFMASSPCASFDAYPRPLPRKVYPQCPRLLPRHLFHPSSSAFVIFCSPAPPRITLCQATKTMFLLDIPFAPFAVANCSFAHVRSSCS